MENKVPIFMFSTMHAVGKKRGCFVSWSSNETVNPAVVVST